MLVLASAYIPFIKGLGLCLDGGPEMLKGSPGLPDG